jgi:hypothetical protein
VVLGIRMPDGRFAFLGKPIALTPALVAAAQEGPRSPERRLRFSGPCVQAACANWSGERCDVIDVVLRTQTADALDRNDGGVNLRPCAIRESCRWFAQAGPPACDVCPEVVTDGR